MEKRKEKGSQSIDAMYTGLEGKGMAARGEESFTVHMYRCSLVIFDTFVSSLTCGVGSTTSLLTIMLLCCAVLCCTVKWPPKRAEICLDLLVGASSARGRRRCFVCVMCGQERSN